MEKYFIKSASYVDEVEPSDTPGEPFRLRDQYPNIILDIYALHDVPCDSSDLACLNDDLTNNQLHSVKIINPEKFWGYTNIVQDSEGNLYAIILENPV